MWFATQCPASPQALTSASPRGESTLPPATNRTLLTCAAASAARIFRLTATWGVASSKVSAAITKANSTDSEKVAKAMLDLTVDTPIGKQTIRSKDQQANRAQFWGKMTKDPKYPFAVMSPPTYIDPAPFMD